MKFALFFAVAFSALVVAFSLQNSQAVQVQFLFWRFEGALVFVLLLTFAIGLLTMFLAALPGHFRSRALTITLRKELEKAHKEAELFKGEENESTSVE
ncbi:MAG: LapA family protein [Desulfurivibrionaceae bacterium]|jgi:uncharacterized integral membrane protein|nr:LapA family protein [Pseudomonadota bacterium]MBU4230119.1 LapA family protein [Pseudomonadota bacterium]MBU4412398.1 LapA family protein [Pseudomonadota bacterium]MDP2001676.1 LapA family protein [Desulfurivibrionaceae bacterium]PKN23684.1 MAG: DUF1049 domain-containing protein [Deltaproteobacteria bacterium HGW-Deltaproteobacteria-3]